MNRFSRWYGAGPLHLLTMLGCLALAGYAAAELLPSNAVGILVWLVGAVVAHDLILFPLYTLADRSAVAVLRHRPGRLPAVPWINYLRVPAVLSGILLLIWFPLILRLPTRFPATTALPLDPYLWHWLAVTGALFLLSAAALAVRLRAVQAGDKQHEEGGHQEQERQAEEEEERKVADAPQVSSLPDTADTPAGAAQGTPSPGPAVSGEAIRPAGIGRLGTVLPDTPLLDGHGRTTTLYTAVGDGPSVLVFYRGARPPYHNAFLSAHEEHLQTRLTERGIPLIAISPQRPDGALDTRRDNGLAFSVLSDPGNAIAGHLGILTLSPPGPAAQSGAGPDLAAVDADRTVALPMPATVILDPGHAARWIHVHPDDTTRADPHQVIDALDQLGY